LIPHRAATRGLPGYDAMSLHPAQTQHGRGCLNGFGDVEYKGKITLRRPHKAAGRRSVETGRFGARGMADPYDVRLPNSQPGQQDEFPTFSIQSSRILPTFSILKIF